MEFVYKLTNKVTGDFYVGYTSLTPERRFEAHRQNAKRGVRGKLYSSMRKHGDESFLVEILYSGESDGLLKEQQFISMLNPNLNMTPGGAGGNTVRNLPAEDMNTFRNKCSVASKKYWDNISKEEAEKRRQTCFGGNKFDRTYMKELNEKNKESGVLKGAKNPACKLTESQVIEIKLSLQSGVGGSRLARKYGVTPTTISYIKLGKKWGWLCLP